MSPESFQPPHIAATPDQKAEKLTSNQEELTQPETHFEESETALGGLKKRILAMREHRLQRKIDTVDGALEWARDPSASHKHYIARREDKSLRKNMRRAVINSNLELVYGNGSGVDSTGELSNKRAKIVYDWNNFWQKQSISRAKKVSEEGQVKKLENKRELLEAKLNTVQSKLVEPPKNNSISEAGSGSNDIITPVDNTIEERIAQRIVAEQNPTEKFDDLSARVQAEEVSKSSAKKLKERFGRRETPAQKRARHKRESMESSTKTPDQDNNK